MFSEQGQEANIIRKHAQEARCLDSVQKKQRCLVSMD